MKNKKIFFSCIILVLFSFNNFIFAFSDNIISWNNISDFFSENLGTDINDFENVETLKTAFNNSNKFWFFDDNLPCFFKENSNSTKTSEYDFDKETYATKYFYISFEEMRFTYQTNNTKNCYEYKLSNYPTKELFLIDVENKEIIKTSYYHEHHFPIAYYPEFSSSLFNTQYAIQYIIDKITIGANNYTLKATDVSVYSDIKLDDINSSEYPWNQTDEDIINTPSPDYSFTVKDNGILPEIATSYFNGYIKKDTNKPDYILDEYYKGENYYKVNFQVRLQENAIYDLSKTKIILAIYYLNKTDNKIETKLQEYMECDALAVFESNEKKLGYNIYNYDLFNIWNTNGDIDVHINAKGIDNIGFGLFLYDDTNKYINSETTLLLFSTDYIDSSTNIDDSNLEIKENNSFFAILEDSKKFLNKFLSFFEIFPNWLISLISTAITVAIVCRIIGR